MRFDKMIRGRRQGKRILILPQKPPIWAVSLGCLTREYTDGIPVKPLNDGNQPDFERMFVPPSVYPRVRRTKHSLIFCGFCEKCSFFWQQGKKFRCVRPGVAGGYAGCGSVLSAPSWIRPFTSGGIGRGGFGLAFCSFVHFSAQSQKPGSFSAASAASFMDRGAQSHAECQ